LSEAKGMFIIMIVILLKNIIFDAYFLVAEKVRSEPMPPSKVIY